MLLAGGNVTRKEVPEIAGTGIFQLTTKVAEFRNASMGNLSSRMRINARVLAALHGGREFLASRGIV